MYALISSHVLWLHLDYLTLNLIACIILTGEAAVSIIPCEPHPGPLFLWVGTGWGGGGVGKFV